MSTEVGNQRLYDTLCKLLDALRVEAPSSAVVYHPTAGSDDALIQARSRALLHLFLKARFGLASFADREHFVTDGTNDGGVDAYYIDQKSRQLFVLQSKFRATSTNFVQKSMTPFDLLKMDVKRILKGEKCNEKGVRYNDGILKRLQRDVRNLSDIASYDTRVVLLGNTKDFSPLQLKRLVEGYPTDQFPHDRTYQELLYPLISGTYFRDPNLTIEINLANARGDTHLDYDVRVKTLRANIKLLFVPTREVGRIMHTYKNSILKFNPRSFLELKNNPVNKLIAASIKNKNGNEFALFNNGITIVTEATKISSDTAKKGTGQVVLTNPQLVNGGQTAFTLGRIYESCQSDSNPKVFRGKEVLLKVITFLNSDNPSGDAARRDLLADISKASNSQTKVEEEDRRSNDRIQIEIQEKFFENYGLYYERKKGEFSDGLHYGYLSPDLIIDRKTLVRLSLACSFQANQARSTVKKYFKEGAIENVLKTSDIAKYMYAQNVLDLLNKKLRAKPRNRKDRFRTKKYGQAFRYGTYAVVAVCANRGPAAKKNELQSLESVLSRWPRFEKWLGRRRSNRKYKNDGSFDYDNYYKGSTINDDLQTYRFNV